MSWAEVKKINSDMNEPLNYLNYIYDISMFKENSYVMSEMNKPLWDDVCYNSSYLYGHSGIHDVIHDKLSIENIDKLWETDFNLGKKLNLFHSTDIYTIGKAPDVIPDIKMQGYNLLEPKFRQGYQRYVEKRLTSDDCGEWLNEIFDLKTEALTSITDVNDIINSSSLFAVLLKSEPVIVAMTSSTTVVDMIANSPNAIALFTENILLFSENEIVISAIVNNSALMPIVLDNEEALISISNNINSTRAILHSSIAFEQLLSNEKALDIFTANETSNEQIGLAFMDYVYSEYVLTTYKNNFNIILDLLPDLIGGNAVLPSLVDLRNRTFPVLAELSKLSNFADIVTINFSLMLNDTKAMTAISNSKVAMTAIINDEKALTAISNSEKAMTAIVNGSLVVEDSHTGGAGDIKTSYNGSAFIIQVYCVSHSRLGISNDKNVMEIHDVASGKWVTLMKKSSPVRFGQQFTGANRTTKIRYIKLD